MGERLEDQFRMPHLQSTEEMLEEARVEEEKAAQPLRPDPRDQDVWVFQFDWTDKRGKRWTGEFENHILQFAQLQTVAVLKAKFLGGMPLESFDNGTLIINAAVAHMSVSLRQKPEWAEDLRKLKDLSLIMALWEKVDSHESTYFRLSENP